MLPFFPSPYPDELLYSVIARYQLRLGSRNARATASAMFGSSAACATFDLPSRLNALHLNLPHGTLNTPERLIRDNTLFPYYRRFLSPTRAANIEALMCSNDGNRIHTSIGISASSIPTIHRLRFCRECIEADTRLYGESYWHRSHQFFGVSRCHRHGSWLFESIRTTPSSGNKRSFSALDEIFPLGSQLLESDIASPVWMEIALSTHWLLDTHAEQIHEPSTLRKRYLWWLWKKQIVPNPFSLKIRQVSECLHEHYGGEVLEQLRCDFAPSDDYNWVAVLLRKHRKSVHPLHHLLFIHFLGITPEMFFQMQEQPYQPFGRGPWPCLNPAASHYRERVISLCECDHVNECGQPVGIFRCDCGYAYGRARHDDGENDRFQRDWVVSFGPVWEKELLRLRHEECLGLRETARLLEVDTNTVKFQLDRLQGVEAAMSGSAEEKDVDEKELTLRRDRWLQLLSENPDKGRKELRNEAKADYAWLYRHDRGWLFDHQAETVTRAVTGERLDWQQRDLELVEQIPSVAETLLGLPGLPQRISIATIGSNLGKRSLIEKKAHKLPKTSQALQSLVDSDASFIRRRLAYAITALQSECASLASWRVLKKAAIRDTPTAREILQELLSDK